MGKVDLVICMLECMCEGQRVIAAIEARIFTFKRILIVVNIFSNSMPAKILASLSWANRIAQDPHSVIVQRVWLRQVENIEFDSQTFEGVSYSKEVPLSMSIRVDVVLQNEIILIVANFHCCKQISSLKSRLKDESFIIRRLRHIVWWRWKARLTDFGWLRCL